MYFCYLSDIIVSTDLVEKTPIIFFLPETDLTSTRPDKLGNLLWSCLPKKRAWPY